MNRRGFIKNSTLAALLPFFIDALEACHVKTARHNRIFVIIQLIGGNDGLNTLIPLDNYKKIVAARPNLYIPENKVLSLKGTSATGLHPAMEGIKDLYDNGLAQFVQGVGYENPNYSHFRAADIWLTGSESTKTLYTGWMARYLETQFKNYPQGFPNPTHPDPPAIKIGDTGTFLFQGDVMDLSIVIDPAAKGFETPEIDPPANESDSYAGDEIKSIREILMQTERYSKVLSKALNTSMEHSKSYPKQGENPLADQLKVVAKLINAGLETSTYMVDLKGFDTHESQVDKADTTKGSHADLLHKISQAVTCFWDDMNRIGREQDVAGMTFSEFGRRIKSNASYGTDHGAAQPVMFFGANLNPGIIGTNPAIPDVAVDGDNLAWQFDHRAVYSSVLRHWYSLPDNLINETLPGKFADVKIFKS